VNFCRVQHAAAYFTITQVANVKAYEGQLSRDKWKAKLHKYYLGSNLKDYDDVVTSA